MILKIGKVSCRGCFRLLFPLTLSRVFRSSEIDSSHYLRPARAEPDLFTPQPFLYDTKRAKCSGIVPTSMSKR
jgi:hypothetical protein